MGALATLEDLAKVKSLLDEAQTKEEVTKILSDNRMIGYKNMCYLLFGWTAEEVKSGKKSPASTVSSPVSSSRKRIAKRR